MTVITSSLSSSSSSSFSSLPIVPAPRRVDLSRGVGHVVIYHTLEPFSSTRLIFGLWFGLSFFALLCLFLIAPFFTANTTYTPHLSLPSSYPSTFTVLTPGRATFSLYGYQERIPLLNSTTLSNFATLSSNTSTSYFAQLSFSCQYPVYSTITAFYVNPNGDIISRPTDGDQVSLTIPHCAALNTLRVSMIVFSAASGIHWLLFLSWAVCGPNFRQSRSCMPDPSKSPRQLAAKLACRWTALVVLAGVTTVTGVMTLVSMWVWVGEGQWVEREVEGWTVVMTVLHALMPVVTSGTMWVMWKDAMDEMEVWKGMDPSVDETLMRWSCQCCQGGQRRGDDLGQLGSSRRSLPVSPATVLH